MQHETTPNDNQLALPEPKFGEWLRGIYASESNPHRDGMYVRTIRRTGRLNPGVHYEVTDGNGKFWQYPAQSVERLVTPPADALGAVRELVAKWRHQEPTCSALASQNRKDAFRRCANELEAAVAQAPAENAAAKHWHDLYRKECQLRQDDAARYGQQIVDLEAQAPAVQVTDEMVEAALAEFRGLRFPTYPQQEMRAALEAALGQGEES